MITVDWRDIVLFVCSVLGVLGAYMVAPGFALLIVSAAGLYIAFTYKPPVKPIEEADKDMEKQILEQELA